MLAPPILEKLTEGLGNASERYSGTWPITVGEDARYRKNRGIMLVVMEARRAIEGVLTTA